LGAGNKLKIKYYEEINDENQNKKLSPRHRLWKTKGASERVTKGIKKVIMKKSHQRLKSSLKT
jgi:hypothetical protein